MSARFDWVSFLRRYRVPHTTEGRNVAAGDVNVRCPVCGDADPSMHLGINLAGRGWICRRVRSHSGRSRARLIRLLLRCSEEEARRIAGYEDGPPDVVVDPERASLLRSPIVASRGRQRPRLPGEFHALAEGGVWSGPFDRYLAGRGYGAVERDWVTREYDLRYAVAGPYAWRLVFPVRDRRGALTTWVGHALSDDDEPRYKALSTRPEKACYGQVAYAPITRTLLGLPTLWTARDARALVVVEGPMDAVRLSLYGRALGVYATCTFGLGVTDEQVAELEELAERFPRRYQCIDSREAARPSIRTALVRRLSSAGVVPLRLPAGVKDPGELTPAQAVEMCARAGSS